MHCHFVKGDIQLSSVTKALARALTEAAWGNEQPVTHLLVALLAGGHVLIEDVPGVGKTSLVRCLAQSVGLDHRRMQFTPDLLPSDITGFTYYEASEHAFVFRKGPIFTHILLADEINRTSPKTQSSLLEAMEERQVSIDGEIHGLPDPFLVMATQNPIEHEGTFPLPEAQLDRFLVKISLGYPPRASELAVLSAPGDQQRAPTMEQIMDRDQLMDAARQADEVEVPESVAEYALRVVEATRKHPSLLLGISPRGAISWIRAARALAYLEEDDYVVPDHLRTLAEPVLLHRLVVRPELRLQGQDAASCLQDVLLRVPLPMERRL